MPPPPPPFALCLYSNNYIPNAESHLLYIQTSSLTKGNSSTELKVEVWVSSIPKNQLPSIKGTQVMTTKRNTDIHVNIKSDQLKVILTHNPLSMMFKAHQILFKI